MFLAKTQCTAKPALKSWIVQESACMTCSMWLFGRKSASASGGLEKSGAPSMPRIFVRASSCSGNALQCLARRFPTMIHILKCATGVLFVFRVSFVCQEGLLLFVPLQMAEVPGRCKTDI